MNGFRSDNNWKCQAYASRYVFEDEGKMRSGIEFEVYEPQKLTAFLEKDKSKGSYDSNELFQSLLNMYVENGVSDEAFYEKKLAYFGDEKDVYYLTVWFDVPAEAEEIIITDWYTLVNGGVYDFQLVPFIGDEPIQRGQCSIYAMKQSDRETLNQLMEIHSIEGKTAKGQNNNFDAKLNAINQNTLFFGARVYYVGAALCSGIYSAQYSHALGHWVPDQTEVYFDFGFVAGNNSGNAYVRGHSNLAMANLAIITQDLINAPDKIVILSHWHNDHICLVRQIRGYANFNPFWAQSYWIVPQTNAPVANVVANYLNFYGGTLFVIPNVFPANNNTYWHNNNPNLIFGKIDAFNPVTQNGAHPHHHGIYARVQFINQNNTAVQQMLFAGDCTYEGIPAVEKNNCAYLQVCHHGGDYSLPPCNQNPAVNGWDIPAPNNAPNYRFAVYSANGVTHGHPNANIMARHNIRGWTAPWRTDLTVTGRVWLDYNGAADI